jgi:metal-responsive CopG/Arc/MetJ family transcriptional regulator
MKTAISIPDSLFDAAERHSKRLGISRSRFYSMAIAQALAKDPRRGVKDKLDAVYAKRNSRMDHQLAAMQAASLDSENEQW